MAQRKNIYRLMALSEGLGRLVSKEDSKNFATPLLSYFHHQMELTFPPFESWHSQWLFWLVEYRGNNNWGLLCPGIKKVRHLPLSSRVLSCQLKTKLLCSRERPCQMRCPRDRDHMEGHGGAKCLVATQMSLQLHEGPQVTAGTALLSWAPANSGNQEMW
jgi:hypothetical protein